MSKVSHGPTEPKVGGLAKLVESALGIRPAEQARVGWMLFYSIMAVGGLVITGNVVGRSLFLSAIPKSAIPLKFILPPLATVLVASRYSTLANKYRTDKLVLATVGTAASVILLFRVGLATSLGDHLVFLCALFVFFDVVVSIGMLQFWTMAGELFDPREAKRAFTIISAGGTIASILFGSLLHELADRVASKDLLFLMLACLLGMAASVRALRGEYQQRVQAQEPAPTEKPAGGIKQSLAALRDNSLLRMISILVVVVAFVSCVADYQLDVAIQGHFGDDSQRMVGFLGNFRLWTGLAAAAIQFFLASRLLAKFGLQAALLLLPVAICSGSVAVIVTGGVLWAVILPRATDLVLKYTINQTAFNLLYLPVKPRQQKEAKVLISGILNPTIVCLLGVSFWLVEHYLSIPLMGWSILVLVMIAFWIWTARRAFKYYVISLKDSIRRREFVTDWETANLVDEATTEVLAQSLESENHLSVIHSLDLLEKLPEIDWSSHLEKLLSHPQPEVQSRSIELVQILNYQDLAESVAQCQTSSHPEVAATAIRAYCSIKQEEANDRILPYLQSDSPVVRAAAISGLISHGGLDGILDSAPLLKALLESPLAEDRREGAKVLGELQAKSFHAPLIQLLGDPDDSVRAEAVKAAGKLQNRVFVPHLVGCLEDASIRPYAVSALQHSLGDDARLLVDKVLDPESSAQVQTAALKVLEAQRSPLVQGLLENLLYQTTGTLRTAVCRALNRLERSGIELSLNEDRLEQLLQEEARSGLRLWLYLSPQPTDDLMQATLFLRFRQSCQRILAILALKYPAISSNCLNASLYQDNDRMRAYAIELLDNVLDGETKTSVFPLFALKLSELAALARERYHDAPKSTEPQLLEIARSEDTWLKTCALFTLGELGQQEAKELVIAELESRVLILRDTAWKALSNLCSSEDFAEFRTRYAQHLTGTNYLDSLHPTKGSPNMALSDLEELLFLRTVPLFSELSTEDLAGIVPITKEVHFDKGETLIEQGQAGDCLYVIVEGEVQVSKDGEEVTICRSPETFGELSILGERPRSANCQAQTDLVVLQLDKNDFWSLLDDRPKIAKGVIQVLLKYA